MTRPNDTTDKDDDIQEYYDLGNGTYRLVDPEQEDPAEGQRFTYDQMMHREGQLDIATGLEVNAGLEPATVIEHELADGSTVTTEVYVHGTSLALDNAGTKPPPADDPASMPVDPELGAGHPDLEGYDPIDPTRFVDAPQGFGDGRTDPPDEGESTRDGSGEPPGAPKDWVDGPERDDHVEPIEPPPTDRGDIDPLDELGGTGSGPDQDVPGRFGPDQGYDGPQSDETGGSDDLDTPDLSLVAGDSGEASMSDGPADVEDAEPQPLG